MQEVGRRCLGKGDARRRGGRAGNSARAPPTGASEIPGSRRARALLRERRGGYADRSGAGRKEAGGKVVGCVGPGLVVVRKGWVHRGLGLEGARMRGVRRCAPESGGRVVAMWLAGPRAPQRERARVRGSPGVDAAPMTRAARGLVNRPGLANSIQLGSGRQRPTGRAVQCYWMTRASRPRLAHVARVAAAAALKAAGSSARPRCRARTRAQTRAAPKSRWRRSRRWPAPRRGAGRARRT